MTLSSDIKLRQGAKDGQTFQGSSLPIKLANFVKLPHTIFGLPFTLVGLCFASTVKVPSWDILVWVLVAFTSARFAAMGFNRIVDRDVDALNPRTSMRELPQGALTVSQAGIAVVITSALFVYSAYKLNPLCLFLSPIALMWVLGYSYTKRFTRWSHIWLGLGLGIAPVGGFLAVTGEWSSPWWMLCLLSLAVVTWTGGFDILYALQDAEFDKKNGLHSLPSSIGESNAIVVARVLHLITIVCLAAVVISDPLNYAPSSESSLFPILMLWLGVLFSALLLLWEHRLVSAKDISQLDAAFFLMNGIISMVFFFCVLVATLFVHGLIPFPNI